MPSATFGLFVNSSTVEAKNLTVGVESYESTVTSGVFALVGDLSAETLTINVKAAEEVDPDVESIGNASPAFDYSEGTYGLYAQDSTEHEHRARRDQFAERQRDLKHGREPDHQQSVDHGERSERVM